MCTIFLQLDAELFEGGVYSTGNFMDINDSRIVQVIQLGLGLRSQLHLWEDTQLLCSCSQCDD